MNILQISLSFVSSSKPLLYARAWVSPCLCRSNRYADMKIGAFYLYW